MQQALVHHTTEPPQGLRLPMPVEVFKVGAEGEKPGIIFLHGAKGLTPRYYPLICHLAEAGFVTFVPRYLAQAGMSSVGPQNSRRNFPRWLHTLINALGTLASYPEIDSARIGVVGISLGASLGLAMAAHCYAVKAVAGWYCDVPRFIFEKAFRMPPTLILHGGSDIHVPVQTVQRLAMALRQEGVPCEMQIYPGERHVFRPVLNLQAATETIGFLQRYL